MTSLPFSLGDKVSIANLTNGEIVQIMRAYRTYPDSEPADLYLVAYEVWPNEPKRSQWERAERLILRERAITKQEKAA